MSSTGELKHTLTLKHCYYYYTAGTSEQVNDGGQLATGWAHFLCLGSSEHC